MNCLEVFTRYFNWNLKTHFNYGQIRQMMDSCQIDFDPCDFSGPTLCGKNEPDNAWINAQPNDCADTSSWATMIATQLETIYRDSLVHDFNEAYTKKCLNVQGLEQFSITKPVSEYHYTLYYYDQAGNLVKTIPPEGVHPVRDTSWLRQVREKRDSGLVLVPDHNLPTVYRYNSLNQVVSQKSPDGGRSEFWYDRLGRLVISQNAKQRANENYSYTRYDFMGRIVEVGQKHQVIGMNQAISRNPVDLQHWIDFRDYDGAYWPTMVTLTGYDVPSEFQSAYVNLTPFSQNPYTLRNRVSFSRYFDQLQVNSSVVGADTVYAPLYLWHNTSVEYSYDIHGNVDSMLNIAFVGTIMNSFGHNAFKMITYKYDLISGKVNEVHYQPGFADEFYHRYEYDADNRLTDVYTTENKAFLKQPGLEEHDAHYEYYKHGPLARTVLGQQQVQGLDYAYTLQGWLKGVNSTALNPDYDMGSDGQVGGINSHVARDAYGFNLNYFTGEYAAINGSTPFPGHTSYLTSGYNALYNGNISSMTVNIGKFNQPQLYNYKYDQLNRITKMDVYRGLNETTNSWSSLAATTDYQERVAYDGNGNILKYLRKGTGSPLDMDSLNYHYNEGTNQLNHVRDSVSSSNYTVDIDDQPVNNYRYDEIGNLIKDSTEQLNIEWNVYGKISKIFKTPHVPGDATEIDYHYDPNGNRVGKTLFKYSAKSEQLWYVRDAQGNVMAVYDFYYNLDFSSGPLKLIEHHIYGSSRLGIVRRDQDMDSMKVDPVNANLVGATYLYQTERGKKLYELSNHLGNVLVTISDRKLGHDDGTGNYDYYTADVVNASDYFPFGMMMPGRNYSDSSSYRYGFNGKENDNEVKGEGNQQDYGMRVYDPRLGKFLSVDPLFKGYPELSTYQYASNTPIQAVDVDGLEAKPNSINLGFELDVEPKQDNLTRKPIIFSTQAAHKSSTSLAINLNVLKLDRQPYTNSGWLFNTPFKSSKISIFANNVATSAWNQSIDAIQFGVNYITSSRYRTEYSSNVVSGTLNFIKWYSTTNANQKLEEIKGKFLDIKTYENLAGSFILGKISSNTFESYFSRPNGQGLVPGTAINIESLSSEEARIWYNAKVKKLNSNLPYTSLGARIAVGERNVLKMQARLMMEDTQAAAGLEITDPIHELDFYIKKYTAQGFKGKSLWKKIIEVSKTPNKEVNDKFGVK